MATYVVDMIKEYLKNHNFDGLCCLDGDENCGCGIDDLAPCGEIGMYCQPAIKIGRKYHPEKD